MTRSTACLTGTLQAQGLDYVGLPRKPLGELDEANKRKIEKILADMK